MKIGILTFHAQLNYGGVLQCRALQDALEGLGHEVVVVDRWLDDHRNIHDTEYDRMGWWPFAKFWLRVLRGRDRMDYWLRIRRTKAFLRRCLRLTPYHFVDWKDAPDDLGLDRLVAGSDQIWHCGSWGDPRAYLLDGAPDIPAIAYAASFGMRELPRFLRNAPPGEVPVEAEPVYKAGLARFKAISCRESEGVEICRKLDVHAAHVVDPVLLAHLRDGQSMEDRPSGPLVCYFLSEDLEKHMPTLKEFSRRNGCRVEVFLDRKHARPAAPLRTWLRKIGRKSRSRVSVMASAGPEEFFRAFQHAKWVLSDSFHALMFAIIHGSNARILRPATELRRQMFARIEEFAAHSRGPLVADSVGSALESFDRGECVEYDYEWLRRRRRESLDWLSQNLT